MSTSHRHGRARVQLDQLIRGAYQHLEIYGNAASRRVFTRLLAAVHERSTLLRPIAGDGLRKRVVQALTAMAGYHRRFVAQPETWAGGEDDVFALIQSLAQHLLGEYPVPRCLANVWLEGACRRFAAAREWFIFHARGLRFREIPQLPMPITRKMERMLMQAPHHLDIHAALRWSELRALGAEKPLIQAVLDTRLGRELERGEDWREVMRWLVRWQEELSAEKVGAIIDLVDELRFTPTRRLTMQGPVWEPPPEPDFSLRGRTPESFERLIAERQYRQTLAVSGFHSWKASGLMGMVLVESLGKHGLDGASVDLPGGEIDEEAEPRWPPRAGKHGRIEWSMVELLDSKQLQIEGKVLRHCVAIYASRCRSGHSSIWSLRRSEDGGEPARRYTIEVDPKRARIIQIRGSCNALPRDKARAIIARWAEQAGLSLGC